jgi:ABC-2 type transport system permease protein
MLWYKAWLETRARFLLAVLGTSALCGFVIYHGDGEAMPYSGQGYYYYVLHAGLTLLCTMWLVGVTLLAMGGLLREKAFGTAPFTLALPVSRGRLVAVRITMAVCQAAALAIVPWSAMFTVAVVTGKVRALDQPFYYLLLLLAGGSIFFAVALLVSSLVEGEYTAPVVSFGLTLAMSVLLADGPLRWLNPYAFINGVEYYDRHSGLMSAPIPWAHAAANLLVAAVLIAASIEAIRRREF